MSIGRQALAEGLGTAFLLMAIVGSGIMASQLSTDAGVQLLSVAVMTGAALAAIILAVGPVSGAHLNPVVSVADWVLGGLSPRRLAAYVTAQVLGGLTGTMLANAMFSLPLVSLATTSRSGAGLWLGESIATAGLLLVIFGMVRSGATQSVAFAVGSYIAAAHFFTSSISFANPAVTFARSVTDTFAGIIPNHVPMFVLFQLVGGAVGVIVVRALYPDVRDAAGQVVLPHDEDDVAA